MDCDSILSSSLPILNPELVIIRDEGELPKGLYYYFITSIDPNGESVSCHTLQVYAKNKLNSVILSWVPIPHIVEYRIYRGKTLGHYNGYFTVFGNEGYFCDDGRGILQENICQ